MVDSNGIYDQPDDGLEKKPETCSWKTPKVRYVNKTP
jgi:hypothetical protein